ncbi:very short patch repair endonuclease [Agromyces laixinhei]|uniref:very short patch repair endonuclease n=1 Tax=Agromyces laixinhei TaxID=2585717 RepID=UPI001F347428
MVANRGRDTNPELVVRRVLHAAGMRYRVNATPVPGVRRTADVVFTRVKLAVFIDGCFWHGCTTHYQRPAKNQAYWDAKVEANRRRDRETDALLRAHGWTVLRIWEHDVRAYPEGVGTHIRSVYEELRTSHAPNHRVTTRPATGSSPALHRLPPASSGPGVD